eukprot:11210051-Lingulodinium_polyedra.AAC.1
MPEVILDYCFVRRQEESAPLTIWLLKDRGMRALRAWVMQHKGADTEEVAERALEGIRSLGHRG